VLVAPLIIALFLLVLMLMLILGLVLVLLIAVILAFVVLLFIGLTTSSNFFLAAWFDWSASWIFLDCILRMRFRETYPSVWTLSMSRSHNITGPTPLRPVCPNCARASSKEVMHSASP
jgi:hypothetical protein